MKISIHLVASLALAIVLFPIFNWRVLYILIGGILIDIDHYFWYVYKFRRFGLFDSYGYFLDGMDKHKVLKNVGILLVFHTIEFLIVIVFLSFKYELFIPLLIGIASHYLLDLTWLYTVPKRLIANHSLIYWIMLNKIQKV